MLSNTNRLLDLLVTLASRKVTKSTYNHIERDVPPYHVWISLPDIAETLGVSVPTAKNCVERLVNRGDIEQLEFSAGFPRMIKLLRMKAEVERVGRRGD